MHSRAKIRRCSFFTHNKVQGQINKAAGEESSLVSLHAKTELGFRMRGGKIHSNPNA